MDNEEVAATILGLLSRLYAPALRRICIQFDIDRVHKAPKAWTSIGSATEDIVLAPHHPDLTTVLLEVGAAQESL